MTRSDRNNKWSRRANAGGCMWGLISMFDFRRGISSPRFLTNPQRGSHHAGHWYRRHGVKLLADFKWKSEELDVKSATKKVINNKNIGPQHPGQQQSEADKAVAKLEDCSFDSDKSYVQTNNKCDTVCNLYTDDWKLPICLETERHIFLEVLGKMKNGQDLVALLEELNSYKKKDQGIDVHTGTGCHLSINGKTNSEDCAFAGQFNKEKGQNCPISQEVLNQVLQVLAYNVFSNGRTNAREIRNSEEFKRLLMVLNSNELCRTILLDNQMFPGGNGRPTQYKDPSNNKQSSPRQRDNLILKDEPPLKISSKSKNDSRDPKRIQVLNLHQDGTDMVPSRRSSTTPCYSPHGLRFSEKKAISRFSFQEVKRSLKHFIGDNRNCHTMIAKDGIMHRIPTGCPSSGSISKHLHSEMASYSTYCPQETPSAFRVGRKGTKEKGKEIQSNIGYGISTIIENKYKDIGTEIIDHHKKDTSNMRMNGKRLRGEILHGAGNDKKSVKGSKTLRELLAFPEYDKQSPDKEPFLSPRIKMKQETDLHPLQLPNLKLENSSLADFGSTQHLEEHNTDPDQIRESILAANISSPKGTVKDDCKDREETCSALYIMPKEENKCPTEIAIGLESNEVHPCLGLGLFEERCSQPPSNCVIPVAVVANNGDTATSTSQNQERPSLSSLLLPYFSAKRKIHRRHISLEEQTHLDVLPNNSNLCVNDEEFKFGYLRALLDASGLCDSDAVDQLQFPTQLLDPSLYDEVETPSEEVPDDLKLFFDCMNEALEEIYMQSSTFIPWVAQLKPNLQPFPSGEHLIQEVWKVLNCKFVLQSPAEVEQIANKDLDGQDWADIRSEALHIGNYVEDSILEWLLGEIILELCHQSWIPQVSDTARLMLPGSISSDY